MTNDERLDYCVIMSGATLFKLGNNPFVVYYNTGGGPNQFALGAICSETGKVLYGDQKKIDELLAHRLLIIRNFIETRK